MNDWTVKDAERLYAIPAWSEGYVNVDGQGYLCVRPGRDAEHDVRLSKVADTARAAGLRLPLLIRFPDILRDRAGALKDAFGAAMDDSGFGGDYTPVYPIKVNQQAQVVHTLAGVDGLGLEVGSKPELTAAIAVSAPGGLIVCNGYKDRQYIRLALSAQELGLKVIVVIEKPGEWPLIRREAQALGIIPVVGVRLRLASLGTGNWQNTGGERAKFGLLASQVMALVEDMRSAGCLDWLGLLHFHMGSQISNLRDIARGVREAGRYLVELSGLGVNVRYLDIGGGLGVDYEGARSRTFCSINYSLAQYAGAIVSGLGEMCRERGLTMPHLISESGRALTAHHAVMITDVTACEAMPAASGDGDHPLLAGLTQLLAEADQREPEECYLEAEHYLEEGRNLFLYGDLELAQRARLEPLYYAVLRQLRGQLDREHRRHRELMDRIDYKLSDKLFINLSIFQSLPDIWAIDQVFPICPLAGLDTRPTARAVLEDLTCDSDGRIDRYVERGALEATLPVHTVVEDEEYLLGIFLVGAYQETLGDMHNLFGDTDSVDVVLNPDGFELAHPRQGDSAETVLRYVGFKPEALMEAFRDKLAAAGLADGDAERIETLLSESLSAYTYQTG